MDQKVDARGYDFRPAHAAMQRFIDEDILSGMSSAVLVGRDLVDLNCVGWADREAQTPLRADHIFRMRSCTKLITSCAALMLFEEGRFQLDDPIERYIPQLANRCVLLPDAVSLDETEPAAGPITIRHLFSHSSGLSYGLFDPGTVIFKAYNDRKVLGPDTTLAEMMDLLAELPLVFHPGASWEYSVATDVLARLIEVISGQRFDTFIQSRILDPLGMVDTGFVVPEHKRNRLVTCYAGADPVDQMKPGLTRSDDNYAGAYLRPFPRLNGGGGLVSTLPDMLALIRSLFPGGSTLLKSETITLMMTNQLPNGLCIRFPATGELQGTGFGLAGGLVLEPSGRSLHQDAKGEFYWGGTMGTHWWISPRTNSAGLLMAQRQMAFAPFVFKFKRMAYEALRRKS
jgi:CubicO group peptidase (beta-lactamase class C family)